MKAVPVAAPRKAEPADKARQRTAAQRRENILHTLNKHLGSRDSETLRGLRERLGKPLLMVASADIDGLVSAMMVASVSEWRIAALVVASESVLTAPSQCDLQKLMTRDDLIGMDVFSPLFPSISNHPVFFGVPPRAPKKHQPLWTEIETYDNDMRAAAQQHRSINPSIWAGIKARYGPTAHDGIPYKYPLGTAQLLLAALEAARGADLGPRFFDREFLPWIVANCDGGIETIRNYPWNVEMWWSSLAAVVGPASQSEALYRLATTQRPTQFIDVDRRLRYEYPDLSTSLNEKWNLVSRRRDDLALASRLLSGLSGWPDPFLDGVDSLPKWCETTPTRNALGADSLTKVDVPTVQAHLSGARRAIHANFSIFRDRDKKRGGRTSLGWMLPVVDEALDKALGEAPEEVTSIGDEPPSAAEIAAEVVGDEEDAAEGEITGEESR